MVRLGAGGLDGRALTPEAMQAALQVLSKFRRLAESHTVDHIVAVAACGSMSGSLCWYYLARFSGSHPGLRPFLAWLGRFAVVSRASGWYADSMMRMALVQLVPTARVYSGLASAMVSISAPRFVIATFIGCVIWNGALISAGWMVRHF